MEQHTWPRASSVHAFSTIPFSHHSPSSSTSAHQHHCLTSSVAFQSSNRGHRSHHRRPSLAPPPHVHPSLNHPDKPHIGNRKGRKHDSSMGRMPPSRLEPDAYLSKHITSLLAPSRTDVNAYHNSKGNSFRPVAAHELLPALDSCSQFAMLPDDILLRIAGGLSWPNLWSASMVCRSWSKAMAPLREAMLFVHWGKRFKHGRGGVARNLDKALDSFLKGAARGCAAAMVDAGLLLWETGHRQEGVYWYRKAAELGDPAGQCNLGLAYLQDPANPTEAVKWFRRAAASGHVRAQYSLALCLQQGRGVECNSIKAARWYQQAAEGGSARAMYNLAMCYRKGEGLNGDLREARKWMKRAALYGHRKAQFEHGLTLFAESEGALALVFLELATRAGETAATHLRDALLQQLSPEIRTYAITCADEWQAKLITRV